VREDYVEAAKLIAQELARRNIGIVYGGGNTGLMGALATEAIEAGAEVIGVMPHAMVERERAHRRITDLHIVGSMHERKALMSELADAFIALPGGYGTFEEFCEVLTWIQLGLLRKPCGILNVAGYYDYFLRFFDHAVAEQFVQPPHREMIIAETRPAVLIDRVLSSRVPETGKYITMSET
jgi:uncharacterized protein (TIGR00730 family)